MKNNMHSFGVVAVAIAVAAISSSNRDMPYQIARNGSATSTINRFNDGEFLLSARVWLKIKH